MKALIEKKREVIGSADYRETTKTTWYILCIPVYHSNVTITR